MDDAERRSIRARRFVRRMQADERIADDGTRDVDRDQSSALPCLVEAFEERRALDVVHDEPEAVRIIDDVEDRDDVRMLDPRSERCLVEEVLSELLVLARER